MRIFGATWEKVDDLFNWKNYNVCITRPTFIEKERKEVKEGEKKGSRNWKVWITERANGRACGSKSLSDSRY